MKGVGKINSIKRKWPDGACVSSPELVFAAQVSKFSDDCFMIRIAALRRMRSVFALVQSSSVNLPSSDGLPFTKAVERLLTGVAG